MDETQVIICVVGDLSADIKGIAGTILHAVREVPLRMISYGGSNNNLSMLVKAEDKKQALVELSKNIFQAKS